MPSLSVFIANLSPTKLAFQTPPWQAGVTLSEDPREHQSQATPSRIPQRQPAHASASTRSKVKCQSSWHFKDECRQTSVSPSPERPWSSDTSIRNISVVWVQRGQDVTGNSMITWPIPASRHDGSWLVRPHIQLPIRNHRAAARAPLVGTICSHTRMWWGKTVYTVTPTFRRQRQEDHHKFKARLRLCHRSKRKNCCGICRWDMAHTWRPEGSFVEVVLSFLHYLGFRD